MGARQFAIQRRAAVVIGLVTIAINIGFAASLYLDPGSDHLRAIAQASSGLTWSAPAALGVLIAIYGVRTPGTTSLALALVLASLNDTGATVAAVLPPATARFLQVPIELVGMLGAGAFVRASQLFPRQLTPTDLFSERAPFAAAPPIRSALAALLRPWAGWSMGVVWLALEINPATGILPSFLVVSLAATYFYVQSRVGSAKARKRVLWLLQMALVFLILFALSSVAHAMLDSRGSEVRAWHMIIYNLLATTLGMGCLAMAVFGAGAVNPSLVLRATVVWGLAATILLFVLNVLTSALVDSLADMMGVGDRLVAATLGALAGLALNPLVNWLKRKLERSPTPQSAA